MTASQPAQRSLPAVGGIAPALRGGAISVLAFLGALRASCGCGIVDLSAKTAAGCAEYASGTCQAYARCGAEFLRPYASVDVCASELAQACTTTLGQPDVLGSGDGAAACGALMAAVTCEAIANGELPAGCQAPIGKRSDGAACSLGAQCASGRCARVNNGWGACRERVELGQPCAVTSDCQAGLRCSSAQLCLALGQVGQTCSAQAPCRVPLACIAGSCRSVDDASACGSYATALCARLASCSASLLAIVYGDQAACAARNIESCMHGLHWPDSASTSAGVAGCAAALPAVACQALLQNALPDACRLAAGARANGQACGSGAQCASTRCERSVNTACGVCAALAGAEEPCSEDGDCGAGLVCAGAVCRTPGELGASCDPSHPCAFASSCSRGSCAEALEFGAACDANDDRCSRDAGLLCGGAGMCEPWLNAGAGQACGYTSAGWAVCSGGAICSVAASPTDGGICTAPASDGSACNADTGPGCLPSARCVAGACSIADAVTCP